LSKSWSHTAESRKEYGKNFRFTLTTNGILLDDEVMEFANREMSNVVLSLDGRKEVHDRLRTNGNGRGSYDIILPKFRKWRTRAGRRITTYAAPTHIIIPIFERYHAYGGFGLQGNFH
jgi:sulfatase maturation enzyme AslB (radical SAM superfamily)